MREIADISSFQALQDAAHSKMGISTVSVFNMSDSDPIYKAFNAWSWEKFKKLVHGEDAELDKFISMVDNKQKGRNGRYSEDFISSMLELEYEHPDMSFWDLWEKYKDTLLWPRLEWQYDEEDAEKEVYA